MPQMPTNEHNISMYSFMSTDFVPSDEHVACLDTLTRNSCNDTRIFESLKSVDYHGTRHPRT